MAGGGSGAAAESDDGESDDGESDGLRSLPSPRPNPQYPEPEERPDLLKPLPWTACPQGHRCAFAETLVEHGTGRGEAVV